MHTGTELYTLEYDISALPNFIYLTCQGAESGIGNGLREVLLPCIISVYKSFTQCSHTCDQALAKILYSTNSILPFLSISDSVARVLISALWFGLKVQLPREVIKLSPISSTIISHISIDGHELKTGYVRLSAFSQVPLMKLIYCHNSYLMQVFDIKIIIS